MGTRRVLITGCSSGIGLAVAARLAKDELRRFKVVATMRDLEKRGPLEKAAGVSLNKTLEIKQLDACCEASIRDCVNSLPDRRVDVLVNNAGVGMIGPLECQSIPDMKELFDTNFFGLARLVKELLPDMKRRKSGHIVVMSSVMGIQGLLFNDVYSASKFAVEGFCESLAVQAMKFNIKTTLVEPGPVVTEFERKVYEDAEKMDLTGADEETAKIFREVYLPYSKKIFASLGQTPEEVAEQTLKVITAKEPPLRHQTNRLYMPLTALKHADPTGRLPLDTFYKMTFNHDRVFSASLGVLRLLQGKSKKI
ncbi:retinol dehydrogenase 8 [Notolabrus celidotus]|uniref:retinol dehydrogenase 8 n=1 Tax=Notolabrus celidotus TaxID=1203425 RepID=UPI00149020B3|nr:retinol dehydrogenase 8 [Notolabrus celidotus]XP_034566704.1 retinol dehydrogenase 8 [Notolabrus celidotus]XP_034566705.1 retinol dehydrogenase 8 [Notolabrus celidotus]XP_034566706.1 retinol dehydrogenase 8 [Notolabrus celidotus]XP_034566708.1 retinol dehydrogenase 8 [Notolabrus celidotus]XP_034566709.1 retinol dehydrogenase 8 [Notolabrus celidotus]XP_034566710.1 retinol dehydrogenase 8 [Notolabrus celidotus]XP_034566711.1 retinol dehydrogenase 8 [Notolabrus celidotus]XP_034566712.1 reti